VNRSRWPAHVTIAGNFYVDADAAPMIPSALASTTREFPAFEFPLGPEALFGRSENIPVLLAEHPAFRALHATLATELSALSGFGPVDPEYWGEGYQPHVTLGAEVHHRAGDSWAIRVLTLLALDGSSAQRLSTVELS